MINEIRKELMALSEEDYKNFSQKLMPGVNKVIGIRLPKLRQYAKKLSKENYRNYLIEAEKIQEKEAFHEEIMLRGFVIGYADMALEERKRYIQKFVPYISNWAVCDSCATGYKFMEKNSQYWYEFIKTYRYSDKEFQLRFMLVSMLSHFNEDRYIDEILQICEEIKNEGYYCRMANAWALQTFYVKYPEKVKILLEKGKLDIFTHNKAIQKIRESYKVGREEKEELKKLKRL